MRYSALIASILALVLFGALTLIWPEYFVELFVLSAALTLFGLHDLLQKRHALLRNYPLLARFR